jgi:hypothetical protein
VPAGLDRIGLGLGPLQSPPLCRTPPGQLQQPGRCVRDLGLNS